MLKLRAGDGKNVQVHRANQITVRLLVQQQRQRTHQRHLHHQRRVDRPTGPQVLLLWRRPTVHKYKVDGDPETLIIDKENLGETTLPQAGINKNRNHTGILFSKIEQSQHMLLKVCIRIAENALHRGGIYHQRADMDLLPVLRQLRQGAQNIKRSDN